MSKNKRLPVDPIFDIPSKVAFYRPEFFKYFTKAFLNLEIDEIKDFHYKYNPAEMDDDKKFLYEFFLNKPYSSENIPSILTETDIFLNETKDWKEKDIMDWIKEQKIRADERKSNALEFARNFLGNIGLSPEVVAENLDLSLDEVLEIQKSLSSSST